MTTKNKSDEEKNVLYTYYIKSFLGLQEVSTKITSAREMIRIMLV